jgi:hypothetical protein
MMFLHRTPLRYILVTILILTSISAAAPNQRVASSSSTLQTFLTPPVAAQPGKAVLKDPSGTYWFSTSGGQLIANLSAYQSLLDDPYTTILAASVLIDGNQVVLTPTVIPSAEAASLHIPDVWGGAGGGFCNSFTQYGYDIVCNPPLSSLRESLVQTNSLSWPLTCFNNAATCETSLWTGLSGTDLSTSTLVQNGANLWILVGGQPLFETFYEEYWVSASPPQGMIATTMQPTTYQNVQYQFEVDFPTTNSNNVNFYWWVGNWYFQQPVTLNYTSQSSRAQAEGVFEGTALLGTPQPITLWSPNPVVMTGWMRTPGFPNYQSANYGSSYQATTWLMDMHLNWGQGALEASAFFNPNNGYTYEVQHY